MGKITSMHFAGWKMGLKTGMYYLRTMAASAPIQFTVDQEQLKVEDTNVARANKQRAGGVSAYSAVPRSNGAAVAVAAVDGVSEEAPRTIVEPVAAAAPPALVQTAVPETNGSAPAEAPEGEKSEADIFSDKVLQCSIENKEACLMCQG